MFGQQNDKPADENKIPDHSIDGALTDDHSSSDSPDSPESHDSPGTSNFPHPGTPLDDNNELTKNDQPEPEVITPENSHSESSNPASEHHEPVSATVTNDNSSDNLIDIKQQALSQLTPLVGHLDQSPEDKFRTTMMMIQASDDKSLVQSAYDAAKKIEDEKVRAQALLDIVNEINYFTQHQ